MITKCKNGKGYFLENTNKKGFTLIELLAVIVILAIIALIATPIILNMINDAKKSAAKDSAYGYIEAVENYQVSEMLKGNEGLEEGIYNIVEETTIGDTKYKKLTDIIKLKGKNPSGGKIGITKNRTVGTATMCINNYVVEYMNNRAEVISEDCEEIGATIIYNISSEKWEMSKELEILYPNGKYEYYYKLESGTAKVEGKDLVVGEEIKSETSTVTIELLENSKITTWMIKNGKKISVKTYEETKIDNVELGEISAEIVTGYPIITEYGIKTSSNLTITYEEQEGTSAQYSVGDGEWKKYNGPTQVSGTKVQVKLVRNESGRSGNIVDAVISDSSPSDALPKEAYDGDITTSVILNNKTYYINVDQGMIGKNIKLNVATTPTIVYYYDKDNKQIGERFVFYESERVLTIPAETTRINIATGTTGTHKLNEISIDDTPKIVVENIYPTITQQGIRDGYNNVTIQYFNTNIQKLYKIDDGEWQEYQDIAIKLKLGQKITAKGIDKNNKETEKSVYESTLVSDALPKEAYDGDITTSVILNNKKYYLNVDQGMIGKDIKLNVATTPTIVYYYDKDNKQIGEYFVFYESERVLTIPAETTRINIATGTTGTHKLNEISIVN